MFTVWKRAVLGSIAGAAGTLALDVTTYLDMAVRARPSSSVPARTAGRLASAAGVSLGTEEAAETRRSALGALTGYASGLMVGIVYGILRPAARSIPAPVAGVAAGLGVMAASDGAAVAAGATDVRSWGPSGWASDLVPHLVYGLVTAAVFDLVSDTAA
jgi:hypothetical protein